MKLKEFHKIAGPFKYIMPTYFFEVAKECLHEYKNKLFWKDKIYEIKTSTDFFERNHMNVSDDMTEFYFAVNMPPENKSLPRRDCEELESSMLVSSINKIENGLANFGLYDMIRFNYEHVDIPEEEVYGWAVACTFNEVALTPVNVRFCYLYILGTIIFLCGGLTALLLI